MNAPIAWVKPHLVTPGTLNRVILLHDGPAMCRGAYGKRVVLEKWGVVRCRAAEHESAGRSNRKQSKVTA